MFTQRWGIRVKMIGTFLLFRVLGLQLVSVTGVSTREYRGIFGGFHLNLRTLFLLYKPLDHINRVT